MGNRCCPDVAPTFSRASSALLSRRLRRRPSREAGALADPGSWRAGQADSRRYFSGGHYCSAFRCSRGTIPQIGEPPWTLTDQLARTASQELLDEALVIVPDLLFDAATAGVSGPRDHLRRESGKQSGVSYVMARSWRCITVTLILIDPVNCYVDPRINYDRPDI